MQIKQVVESGNGVSNSTKWTNTKVASFKDFLKEICDGNPSNVVMCAKQFAHTLPDGTPAPQYYLKLRDRKDPVYLGFREGVPPFDIFEDVDLVEVFYGLNSKGYLSGVLSKIEGEIIDTSVFGNLF